MRCVDSTSAFWVFPLRNRTAVVSDAGVEGGRVDVGSFSFSFLRQDFLFRGRRGCVEIIVYMKEERSVFCSPFLRRVCLESIVYMREIHFLPTHRPPQHKSKNHLVNAAPDYY